MRCPNEEARYGQLVTLVDGSLLPEMEQRWNVLHLTAWALKDGLHCNVADVIDAGCCLIQGYVFDRPIYSKICEGVAGNPSGTVTKLLERLLAVEGAQEFAARAIASQAPIEELTRILDVVAHEVKAAVVAWLPTTCKTRQDAGVLLKGRLCTDHHRCGYGLLYCAGHYGLADVLKAMKASAVMRSDGYEGEHLRKMFQWARRMCNDKEYRRKNCGSI